MFWLMFAAMTSMWFAAVRMRENAEGLYSTAFVFCMGASIYFLSIPMERFAKQDFSPLVTATFDSPLTPLLLWQIFTMGLAAMVAFIWGLNLSGFKSLSADRATMDTGTGIRYFEGAMWLLWAGLITILFLFYRDYLHGVIQSYEASFTTQYTHPLATWIGHLVTLLNAILAVFLAVRKKLWPVLGAVILFGLDFYLTYIFHEKTPATLALIGIGYLYFHWVKNTKLAVAGALGGILLVFFLLIPVFTILCGGIPSNKTFAQRVMDIRPKFSALDSSGPMVVALDVIAKQKEITYGKGILDTFSILVPRSLWSDRPMDPSEAFAEKVIVGWKPGMGLGYSPIIEAYTNFGFWLSPLEFVIFGFVWGWIWRLFMRLFAFYNAPMHLDIIYRIAGYYLLLIFFRGLMMGTVKQTLMCLIPFGVALAGMQIMIYLWGKMQRRNEVTI